MSSRARVLALFAARNREFIRDRASLIWNIAFPLLLLVGLALVFSGEPPSRYQVGLLGEGRVASAFLETEHIRFIEETDPVAAQRKVARHRLDLVLDRDSGQYWINDSSSAGYILERLLLGSTEHALQRRNISGEAVRYVDWALPGVLGMNAMFSALFGVGYAIVRYRKNGVLKRFKATPLQPLEFLLAQVLSRWWLIMITLVAVFLVMDMVIDLRMLGSYLNLLLVFALGTLSLISLGLLVAARTASEELANGLSNLLSWPMVLLSGVWFSLEGAPVWLQQLAWLLPLTHLVDAARAVMIDGAGLAQIALPLTVLTVMGGGFLVLGAVLFRWE